MSGPTDARADKFLWSVRLFKTRSLASEECKKGRIIINNIQIKSSRTIVKGEIITVKKLPVIYTYKVTDIPGNRVAAKHVANYIEDLTPEEEKNKLLLQGAIGYAIREKGSGRPTKKERRVLDKFNN